MNYFGHAAVAHWLAPGHAGTALGAMAPDLAAMAGAQLATPAPAELTAGVDLHHQTDAVFHRLPRVTALMAELDARLAAAAVRRGPRRAAAHIGVELLLDAVLLDDGAVCAAYLGALAAPLPTPGARDAGDDGALAEVLARLRAHGVPADLRQPALAARRIVRVIASRPLLAATGDEPTQIARAMVELAPTVAAAADGVFAAVRALLAGAGDEVDPSAAARPQ